MPSLLSYHSSGADNANHTALLLPACSTNTHCAVPSAPLIVLIRGSPCARMHGTCKNVPGQTAFTVPPNMPVVYNPCNPCPVQTTQPEASQNNLHHHGQTSDLFCGPVVDNGHRRSRYPASNFPTLLCFLFFLCSCSTLPLASTPASPALTTWALIVRTSMVIMSTTNGT